MPLQLGVAEAVPSLKYEELHHHQGVYVWPASAGSLVVVDGLDNDLEDKLHEALAQIMTYKTLEYNYESVEEKEHKDIIQRMLEVFIKLENHQPAQYRVIKEYKDVPREKIVKCIDYISDGLIEGDLKLVHDILTW